MKKYGLLLAAAALVLQASAANADVFKWSYTDGGANTGSGTITATLISGEQYQVTGIAGTANGYAITQLDSYAFAGQQLFWGPHTDPLDPKPEHFDPLFPYYHTNFDGIGFIGPDGKAFNIYEDAGGVAPGYSCGGAPYCIIGPGASGSPGLSGTPGVPDDNIAALTDFAVELVSRSTTAAVPEPMTLSLFGAGFAGMVALRRRRKAKSA